MQTKKHRAGALLKSLSGPIVLLYIVLAHFKIALQKLCPFLHLYYIASSFLSHYGVYVQTLGAIDSVSKFKLLPITLVQINHTEH